MELIKITESKRVNNHLRQFAIFKCPFCYSLVERTKCNGLRDKGCGCTNISLVHKNCGTKTNLHFCWTNMKTRCKNPNYKKAHRYSERGITLFEPWEDFLVFKEWAIMFCSRSGYRKCNYFTIFATTNMQFSYFL